MADNLDKIKKVLATALFASQIATASPTPEQIKQELYNQATIHNIAPEEAKIAIEEMAAEPQNQSQKNENKQTKSSEAEEIAEFVEGLKNDFDANIARIRKIPNANFDEEKIGQAREELAQGLSSVLTANVLTNEYKKWAIERVSSAVDTATGMTYIPHEKTEANAYKRLTKRYDKDLPKITDNAKKEFGQIFEKNGIENVDEYLDEVLNRGGSYQYRTNEMFGNSTNVVTGEISLIKSMGGKHVRGHEMGHRLEGGNGTYVFGRAFNEGANNLVAEKINPGLHNQMDRFDDYKYETHIVRQVKDIIGEEAFFELYLCNQPGLISEIDKLGGEGTFEKISQNLGYNHILPLPNRPADKTRGEIYKDAQNGVLQMLTNQIENASTPEELATAKEAFQQHCRKQMLNVHTPVEYRGAINETNKETKQQYKTKLNELNQTKNTDLER